VPIVIPGGSSPATGQPDAFFINRVRRALREQAVWFSEPFTTDGTKGAIVAGSSPFRLKRAPVVLNTVAIKLAGVSQTVLYDQPPVGSSVAFISDTGEFYWTAPPATSQSILVTYQAWRYSDQQILDALNDGLQEMWPEIWLPATDTSIIFTPSFTEYTLPSQFNDPRVQIISVEVQPPSGILISLTTGKWDRQGLTNLIMSRGWPAGSILRLTYNAPYSTLGALEGQVAMLPVYYACYKILMDQESMRTRQNDLVALTGEGGNAPEIASATAQLWLDKFNKTKTRLAVPPPNRSTVPDRSVEMLDAGTGFSWNPL
jgi:hypothetical protein